MNLRTLAIVLGFIVFGALPACAWHPEPERICYDTFDGYSSVAAAQAAAALQVSRPGIVRIEGELSAVSNSEIVLRNAARQQLVLKIAPEAGFFVNGYPGLLQAAYPVKDAPFYAVCLADPRNGSIYFMDAVFQGFECDLLQISGMEPAELWLTDTRVTLKFDNGQIFQLSLWPACIISAPAPIPPVADLFHARVFVLCTSNGQIRRIWFLASRYGNRNARRIPSPWVGLTYLS